MQRASGLPRGRIIFSDTGTWHKVAQSFYDPSLNLVGKPDYLIEQGKCIIPVEVKSSHVIQEPYASHIYQLGAYCLLIHRIMKCRPSHGILHYQNQTFEIEFTPALECSLLNLLNEMRAQLGNTEINRSHDIPGRCAGCGYRSICDQKL